jgi:hypothetical protein
MTAVLKQETLSIILFNMAISSFAYLSFPYQHDKPEDAVIILKKEVPFVSPTLY